MLTGVFRVVLLGVMFLAIGCSSYDRRWREAQGAVAPNDPFSGSYVGRWKSTRYPSATGKLWCILSRQSRDVYLAEFRATWHGIFSSTHSVMLRITERAKSGGKHVAKFAGETEIKMWIGSGRYRCSGEFTPAGFVADYDAEYDRGRFELSRVPPGAGKP